MSKREMHSVSLPWNEWPNADRTLWEQALIFNDLDESSTPLSTWAAQHQAAARGHYGAWLKFVAVTEPGMIAASPAARMSRLRFSAYLRHLKGRVALKSVGRALCDFYGIMTSIAGEQDWRWIRRLVRSAYGEADTLPVKQKPFIHADELAQVGEHLIRQAYLNDGQIGDPVAFRDGLLICMLIYLPVRISQLSCMRLGTHLIRTGDNHWAAHWDAVETKSRRHDDHPIHADLSEVLDIYLDEVRPRLQARSVKSVSADTVWIGNYGLPVGPQTIRKIIMARTKAALGRAINPHSFRHAMASTYALELPGRAIEAATILSHANFSTTERYYLLGRQAQAVDVAQRALRAVRSAWRIENGDDAVSGISDRQEEGHT